MAAKLLSLKSHMILAWLPTLLRNGLAKRQIDLGTKLGTTMSRTKLFSSNGNVLLATHLCRGCNGTASRQFFFFNHSGCGGCRGASGEGFVVAVANVSCRDVILLLLVFWWRRLLNGRVALR